VLPLLQEGMSEENVSTTSHLAIDRITTKTGKVQTARGTGMTSSSSHGPDFYFQFVSCHVDEQSSTTLATMRCQSPLSSEALMSCVGLTLSFNESHRLFRYFSL